MSLNTQKFSKKTIVKSLLEVANIQEITCGDAWISINHNDEEFKELGIFVQVEALKQNDTYSFYGYKNILEDNCISSDYTKTLFKFDIHKDYILKSA